MLSFDSSLTMSAITNIAFTSKREGFRPQKPLPWVRPCTASQFLHYLSMQIHITKQLSKLVFLIEQFIYLFIFCKNNFVKINYLPDQVYLFPLQ